MSLRVGFEPQGGGGGTNERTNKRTNKQMKVPCVLQDIVPFGAAAQKAARRIATTRYDSNMAVCMATRVVCGWAGAVIKKANNALGLER